MSETEKDKDYTVTDRRGEYYSEDGKRKKKKSNPKKEQPAETPEEQPVEAQASEEQEEAGQEEEQFHLPPVTVDALLRSFIGMLGSQVWQWMGLVKNPTTGEMNKDLAQAKVAIDTISVLIDLLQPRASEAEIGELKAILSDLRINFVQQSARV